LKIRTADAKEVGMGDPAEETYCPPGSNLLEKSESTPFVMSSMHHKSTKSKGSFLPEPPPAPCPIIP
jgi:hypothetical protein